MRLRYTPEALVELDEILTGIAEHSPQGARRVQARIQAVIGFLLDYPHSGQSTDMDSLLIPSDNGPSVSLSRLLRASR